MQVQSSNSSYYQTNNNTYNYQNNYQNEYQKNEPKTSATQEYNTNKNINTKYDTSFQDSKQSFTEMKNLLNSYYSLQNGGNISFDDVKSNLQNLANNLIGYRVDKYHQTWESTLHAFRMEISKEAYDKFNESKSTSEDNSSSSITYNLDSDSNHTTGSSTTDNTSNSNNTSGSSNTGNTSDTDNTSSSDNTSGSSDSDNTSGSGDTGGSGDIIDDILGI